MSKDKPKLLESFAAGSAAAGFLYQIRYGLHLLLEKSEDQPDVRISIEKFDDVAVEDSSGPIELRQLKLHKSGNLTNKSSDLWKTIRIWADALRNGELQADETLFYIVTTQQAPKGTAAFYLRTGEQRKPECALPILEEAAQTTENEENLEGTKSFLALSKSDRISLLNSLFVLDSSHGLAGIRQKIEGQLRHTVDPGSESAFVDRVEGWWNNQVVLRLIGERDSPLSYYELALQLSDLREQFQRNSLPIDFQQFQPDRKQIEDANMRVFVHQLNLIQLVNPLVTAAIRDYYRAYLQRERWVDNGFLIPGEWKLFEDRIKEEWEFARGLILQEYDGATEGEMQQFGFKLYQMLNTSDEPKLRDKCNAPYVLRGALQELADRKEIGWHLEFLDRLEKLLSASEQPA